MRSARTCALILLSILLFRPALAAEYSAEELSDAKRICDAAGPGSPGMPSHAIPLKRENPFYGRLSALMPAAPERWSAKPADIMAFSSDIIGCGLSATRTFRVRDVDVILEVKLLPSLRTLMAEPAMAGSLGWPFQIKDRPAFLVADGSIVLIARRTVVTVQGGATEAEKMTLLGLIDLDKVGAL